MDKGFRPFTKKIKTWPIRHENMLSNIVISKMQIKPQRDTGLHQVECLECKGVALPSVANNV